MRVETAVRVTASPLFAFVSLVLLVLAATAGLSSPATSPAEPQGASAPRSASARSLRLPNSPYRYANIELPAHFRTPNAQRFDNTPPNNPITDAGAALGRVLFYDTRLSASNTVACGSCHLQAHAFVDPNRFSVGHQGGRTDRHAMNLVNLRFHPRARFFWDERAGNLEEMVLLPVQNGLEMGQDVARLPAVLSADPQYGALFQAAFGDASPTPERIGRALAQFLRSMVSYGSKYDEGRSRARLISDDFDNFTRDENRGKALFLRNCGLCHLPNDQDAHFIMVEPVNTGLDEDTVHTDGGVGDITLTPRDLGRFKSPDLRNVAVAGPHMHDGRFATLSDVIDHYSSGGKNHPNKDVRIQPLRFTDAEKAALIAFLDTLTDPAFLSDPKFSDPFE